MKDFTFEPFITKLEHPVMILTMTSYVLKNLGIFKEIFYFWYSRYCCVSERFENEFSASP